MGLVKGLIEAQSGVCFDPNAKCQAPRHSSHLFSSLPFIGVPAAEQRVVFGGTQLSDDSAVLSTVGIEDGAIVFVVQRIPDPVTAAPAGDGSGDGDGGKPDAIYPCNDLAPKRVTRD